MAKLYLLFGVGVLATYTFTETRGKVFASTDTKSSIQAPTKAGSTTGRRSRSFWFVGGYRGGK